MKKVGTEEIFSHKLQESIIASTSLKIEGAQLRKEGTVMCICGH
jgi:hypothetical protein